MSYEEFVNKILSDAGFRAELENDPEGALKAADITTNMTERDAANLVAAMKSFDWNNARIVANSFTGKFVT